MSGLSGWLKLFSPRRRSTVWSSTTRLDWEVQELASKYAVHRATVFAHLQRREVPRRRPGLNEQEQAEVVRLSREGMSMRAIRRRMGVDRKAVHVALVQAGAIEPARSI